MFSLSKQVIYYNYLIAGIVNSKLSILIKQKKPTNIETERVPMNEFESIMVLKGWQKKRAIERKLRKSSQ